MSVFKNAGLERAVSTSGAASQVIIEGIEGLTSILEGKRFLLVCDSSYDFLPIKDFFENLPHVKFSDFTPNPLYEQVCAGIDLYNSSNLDMIVAVGGGSTIDVAKCIKLYSKMDPAINYLKQETFDSGIELVAIPTTAGTGSESTRHAVIYFEGEKQSISHVSIVPNYACLEPSVLKTLPLYQKKCTMLDALCQAIESWWSVNACEESIAYSRKAVSLIASNWREYIFDNTSSAAASIMRAANLAGRAINITATTSAHAMSYKITSMYSLPHGHAVALGMREVWAYHNSCESLSEVMSAIAELLSYNDFCAMLDSMEMKYPESTDLEADLQKLADSVNPVRLKNNPVPLDHDLLKEMYRRILK